MLRYLLAHFFFLSSLTSVSVLLSLLQRVGLGTGDGLGRSQVLSKHWADAQSLGAFLMSTASCSLTCTWFYLFIYLFIFMQWPWFFRQLCMNSCVLGAEIVPLYQMWVYNIESHILTPGQQSVFSNTFLVPACRVCCKGAAVPLQPHHPAWGSPTVWQVITLNLAA